MSLPEVAVPCDSCPTVHPDGCDDMLLVRGSQAALLTCGDENRLFWPTENRSVTLPVRVETAPRGAAVVIGSDGHPWLPVRANVSEAWRIGRLRMADGRLETGPEIGNIPTPPLTGCSVEAADAQMRLERGPWTLRCVAETSP